MVRFHRVAKKYLDTREVTAQMHLFAKTKKMFGADTQVYAAAHQDHMPRVLRTLKKKFLTTMMGTNGGPARAGGSSCGNG